MSVPSWRLDIEGEADLVEEVLRVKATRHPGGPAAAHGPCPSLHLDERQRRVPLARRVLASAVPRKR